MKTPSCVLDGEVCALDDEGRSSFSEMQQGKGPLVLLRVRPARARGRAASRPALHRAARAPRGADRPAQPTVRLSEAFDDGEALFAAAEEQGLEGIIAKRADSRVPAGQAHARLAEGQDARAPGVRHRRLHERARPARGTLRLARPRRQARRPSSSTSATVGTGFTDEEIDRLLRMLAAARASEAALRRGRRRCPRCGRATSSGSSRSSSCEVEFGEWTHDGRLRAPSYQGLREDKAADEVRRERPLETEIRKGKRVAQALQPRQGLLARRGHHEGRPALVLPRGRAGARPAPARPAVHDEALSRRLAGQALLPEGRAQAHAGLDPDVLVVVSTRGAPRRSARSAARS